MSYGGSDVNDRRKMLMVGIRSMHVTMGFIYRQPVSRCGFNAVVIYIILYLNTEENSKYDPLTWGCCARAVDAAWSLALRTTATIRSALGTRFSYTTLRAGSIAKSVVGQIAGCTLLREWGTD